MNSSLLCTPSSFLASQWQVAQDSKISREPFPFHHVPLNRALPVLARCPNSFWSLCQSCCSGNEPLQSAWRPISGHKQIPKTVPAAYVYKCKNSDTFVISAAMGMIVLPLTSGGGKKEKRCQKPSGHVQQGQSQGKIKSMQTLSRVVFPCPQ